MCHRMALRHGKRLKTTGLTAPAKVLLKMRQFPFAVFRIAVLNKKNRIFAIR